MQGYAAGEGYGTADGTWRFRWPCSAPSPPPLLRSCVPSTLLPPPPEDSALVMYDTGQVRTLGSHDASRWLNML